MKNLLLASLLLLVSAVPAGLCAKRIDLGAPTIENSDIDVTVLSSDEGQTVLELKLTGFDLRSCQYRSDDVLRRAMSRGV